jgi:hypothetical protein
MTIFRVIAGLLNFGIAGLLATHLITAFRFATLPALRGLGQEDTYFVIFHFGPSSFSGWQIVAVEAVVALFAIAFILLGAYAFTGSKAA